MPRLLSFASRVSAETLDYGEYPGEVLNNVIVTGTYRGDGAYSEVYLLVASSGDVDGFMVLSQAPHAGGVECEVSRCCFAGLQISLDDELVVEFPELASPLTEAALGYYDFMIEG